MTIESTGVRKVRSVDGTEIAFERHGTGTALILVDAAGHYRAFSSFGGLIGLLAGDFTVYHYDRRGRGESTDRAPYAVEREVDDLAALIKEAGGSAFLYGFSSGALLAAHAAASGLAIPKLALLEPPMASEQDRAAQSAFTAELRQLVAAGRREAAVEHFLSSIGVPRREDVEAPATAREVPVRADNSRERDDPRPRASRRLGWNTCPHERPLHRSRRRRPLQSERSRRLAPRRAGCSGSSNTGVCSRLPRTPPLMRRQECSYLRMAVGSASSRRDRWRR
jgi:pimeloyl-ACP methyl ester carboxylesterase